MRDSTIFFQDLCLIKQPQFRRTPVWPSRAMACSQGTSAILTLGGTDPRSGRHYVSYETVKGGYGRGQTKTEPLSVPSMIQRTILKCSRFTARSPRGGSAYDPARDAPRGFASLQQ